MDTVFSTAPFLFVAACGMHSKSTNTGSICKYGWLLQRGCFSIRPCFPGHGAACISQLDRLWLPSPTVAGRISLLGFDGVKIASSCLYPPTSVLLKCQLAAVPCPSQPLGCVQIKLMGTRENAAGQDFSGIPLEEEEESHLKDAAVISMGTEISAEDMMNIEALCDQVCLLPLCPLYYSTHQ